MSIAQGLAAALVRAALEKKNVSVHADCFVRQGFPLLNGQEYCRLVFTRRGGSKAPSYGLLFLMNWAKREIAPDSVECF
jgi:hypothetical protein